MNLIQTYIVNYQTDNKHEIMHWNKCGVNQISLSYKDHTMEIKRIISMQVINAIFNHPKGKQKSDLIAQVGFICEQ